MLKAKYGLFSPAVALMNRLKYRNKFALISIIFMLPLIVVIYLLFSEFSEDLNFARRERHGIQYLADMGKVLEELQRASAKQENHLDEALAALEATDLALGEELNTSAQLQGFLTRLSEVRASPPKTADPLRQMRTELLFIFSQVGNTSNMILDPRLDTYYLISAIVNSLPNITDQLTKGQSFSDFFQKDLQTSLSSEIEPILTNMRRGFGAAFEYNQQLWVEIDPQLQVTLDELITALHVLERGAAQQESQTLSDARDSSFVLYRILTAQIDELLAARIEALEAKQLYTFVLALFTMFLAQYLLAGFNRSVMKTVSALELASQKMMNDDMSGTVILKTHDELGLVVKSFNNVATRLRNEWQQAREESERATKAEERHKESEKKFRSIFENATEGIFQFTPEGRFLSANPALLEIYGYTSEDELQEKIQNIQRQLYLEPARYTEFLHRIKEETAVNDFEAQIYRRDGSIIWVLARAHAIYNDLGEIAYYEGSMQDITEMKKTQAELIAAKEAAEEANVAKSKFLATMSHELRTPLNAIIGYSEMLIEEAQDDGNDAMVPDLNKINTAGKHLLMLINDILDLSKIESGKMELHLEKFSFENTLQDVLTTIDPLIKKSQNKLVIDSPKNIGEIRSDITRLRQVLFNLLSNASKFTEHGTITIRAKRELSQGADYLTVAVCDTGIGLTKEQLGKLFQAFSQADSSTTRKYGGTGLGLVICRKICQMLGGEISVESEPGVGSVFTMKILASQEKQAPTQSTNKLPANAKTALVIDDEPNAQELISKFLQKEGVRPIKANSGPVGIALAKEQRPDLITLDVMMPGMDGWAVLSALKSDPSTADIPVVMVSMIEEKEMAYALGVSNYLTKPIDSERFALTMRSLLPGDTSGPVLIVEDDEPTQQMLQKMLSKHGLTSRIAGNGRQGLTQAQEETPSLVLLDLMMPEVDGFAFINEFRKNPRWQDIPVIVITAKELTNTDRYRLSGQVDNVLQKGSYKHADLEQEIKRILTPSNPPRPSASASSATASAA